MISRVINAAVLASIGLAVLYAAVTTAGSHTRALEGVEKNLLALQRQHAHLCRDLLRYRHGELDNAALNASTLALADATAKLTAPGFAHHVSSTTSARIDAVVAAAHEAIDLVEVVKSEDTVARNVERTLPALLSRLGASAATAESAAQRVAFAMLDYAVGARPAADCAAIAAEALRSTPTAHNGSDPRVVTLADVQARRFFDTHRFADEDTHLLMDGGFADAADAAVQDVGLYADRSRRNDAAALQALVISASALLAFIVTLLMQFRSQAVELDALATGLEQRVRERTGELQAERRLLSTILQSIPHAVCWKDADLRLLDANPAFRRMHGLEDEAPVAGLSEFELGGSDAAQMLEADRRVLRQEVAQEETTGSRVDAEGRTRHYWTSHVALSDGSGRPNGVVSLRLDITERRDAEMRTEALLEITQSQKALMDAVLQSAADGIVAVKSTGEIVSANAVANELLGVTPHAESDLGEPLTVDLFLPDGATPLADDENPLLVAARGDALHKTEVLARRAGAERLLAINAAPFSTHDTTGGVLVIRDITPQRRLEKELARAQKLESLGALAAGVAHEINTPMQFVIDNVEFLGDAIDGLFDVVDVYRENLLPEGPPKSWEERDTLVRECQRRCRFDYLREQVPAAVEESIGGLRRVTEIVRAMKQLSHPGADTKTGTDLNSAIRSAATVTKNVWKQVAEVEFDLASDLPDVPTHTSEINQVLLNLLVNAADAIRDRHGEDSGAGRIAVRSRSEQDSVCIDIQDNGCGIPAAILDKIFEPFFTTKEVGKGTGQGLAISYNVVVNHHGGDLRVDSEPGAGTTITIQLPTTPAEVESPVVEPTVASAPVPV